MTCCSLFPCSATIIAEERKAAIALCSLVRRFPPARSLAHSLSLSRPPDRQPTGPPIRLPAV